VNGAEVASLEASGQFEMTGQTSLLIGSAVDPSDWSYVDTFGGDIDELRIYAAALSASAINEDMARSIGASSLLVNGQTPYSQPAYYCNVHRRYGAE
jgi:hypothetical protein